MTYHIKFLILTMFSITDFYRKEVSSNWLVNILKFDTLICDLPVCTIDMKVAESSVLSRILIGFGIK